jgi:phage-related protein
MASKAILDLVVQVKDQATKGLGGIAGGLGKLGLAGLGVGVLTDAVGGLVQGFGDLTAAAASEKLENDQLLQSIKNTDAAFKGSSETLDGLIAKGEALAFSDSAVRESLAKLTAATGDLNSAQSLQALAFDAARAKGMSLEQVTNILAKAQQGSLGGLEKLGVAVDKNTSLQDALAELTRESAGAADLFAESSEGAGIRASAAMDNAKEQIGASLLPIRDGLMNGIAGVLTSPEFQGAISGAAEFLSSTLGAAFSAIQTAMQTLSEAWGIIWPAIQAVVQPILDAVFEKLAVFWTEIEPKLTEIWGKIQEVIEKVMPIIEEVIGTGLQFISDLWGNVWPGIEQVLGGVWTAIEGIVKVAWGLVSGIISAGLSLLSGDWEGAWKAIEDMAATVWEGIQGIVTGAFEIIQGLFNIVLGELKTIWETIWGAIGTKVTEIWESITGEIDKQINAVKTTIDTVTGLLKAAWDVFWDNIWTTVSTAWDNISTGIGTKLGEIKTLIEGVPANLQAAVLGIGTSIVDGIIQGLKNAWSFIEQTISDLAANLPQPIKDALGISSPSQEMADQVGDPIAAGVLLGMQQGWGAVLTGAKDLIVVLQELFYKYVRDQEQEYSLTWHWKTAFQWMFGFVHEVWAPMIKELLKGSFITFAEVVDSGGQAMEGAHRTHLQNMLTDTTNYVNMMLGELARLGGGGAGYSAGTPASAATGNAGTGGGAGRGVGVMGALRARGAL